MRSYLSLIPISAKVHRRQNRMTLLCIIFTVFLVTAVFSMADMGVRMEMMRLLDKHGGSGLDGVSSSPMAQTLFVAAILLFVMILIAGVLMISSSINSNVAQRTKFFGMMRCIGMSRRQIIRFVRLEALNWCKTAVPIGVVLGIVVTWGLCAALRFFVGGEFAGMPLFEVSLMGITSGIVVGVVTVLIAASSPARRAASVAPVTAASGNAQSAEPVIYAGNTRFAKIETVLGIHHAVAAKRNLALMTGSFALSIMLFLSFSVLIEFVGFLMPQPTNASDIDISSSDGSNSIDSTLLDEISNMKGVRRVFGRRSSLGFPAGIKEDGGLAHTIDLISYDTFDLECLKKDRQLRKGSDISSVYGNSEGVLATWDGERPLNIGEKIRIGNEELTIAGLLKFNPFHDDGESDGRITIIASGETFGRLTGEADYSLVMVQMERGATDGDVAAIRNLLDENSTFHDRRSQRTYSTYMAFQMFIYGFLVIITLVTLLNIMNSISMSVSARIKEYGTMRAVGMDERQITKMIAAEAFTYALSGCAAGCVIGLPLHKLLYDLLITDHFSYAAWHVPLIPLAIILLFVFAAAIAAVHAPAKRLRSISVTETIHDL